MCYVIRKGVVGGKAARQYIPSSACTSVFSKGQNQIDAAKKHIKKTNNSIIKKND
jgi:hypothetical protein